MSALDHIDKYKGYYLCREVEPLIIELEAEVTKLRDLVSQQAEDEGLWFIAETAPEAYLQEALRKLHRAIEGEAMKDE
jgi:hypothetical protein